MLGINHQMRECSHPPSFLIFSVKVVTAEVFIFLYFLFLNISHIGHIHCILNVFVNSCAKYWSWGSIPWDVWWLPTGMTLTAFFFWCSTLLSYRKYICGTSFHVFLWAGKFSVPVMKNNLLLFSDLCSEFKTHQMLLHKPWIFVQSQKRSWEIFAGLSIESLNGL